MSLRKRAKLPKKKSPKTDKQPTVFIYNTMMDTFKLPSQRYMYDTMSKSAPRPELMRLMGAFKLPYVSYLLGKIWDKRYVCICEDVETARALYMENPIGSAVGTDENIEDFNKGDYDHIFLTDVDNTDLRDVDALVFIQPSTYNLGSLAVLRESMRNAEDPKLYFFMLHDSIDDELKKTVMGISPKTQEVEFNYKLVQ